METSTHNFYLSFVTSLAVDPIAQVGTCNQSCCGFQLHFSNLSSSHFRMFFSPSLSAASWLSSPLISVLPEGG